MASPTKRIGMVVKLKPDLIGEYVERHKAVWPEVKTALRKVGIEKLSLFLFGELVFMYMEYRGQKPFEQAMAEYIKMPRVAEWETEMKKYKQVADGASEATGFTEAQEIYHME